MNPTMKTKRSQNLILAAAILVFALAGRSTSAQTGTPQRRDLAAIKAEQAALTPAQVLESLRLGNERFVSGKTAARDMLHDQRITAAGQYPHAVILSCIDSRAPAEIIFDAGLGDLFNARIAGNIADADLVGSMEFACAVSGAKLVLVMGHTSCGAIKGACDHVELGNLTGLLEKIKPAVEAVRDVPGERNSKNTSFVEAVSETNVRLTVERIRELSPILRDLEKAGKIEIAGCIYDLETGRVRFFRETHADARGTHP
jgi:carbonic anhydrase